MTHSGTVTGKGTGKKGIPPRPTIAARAGGAKLPPRAMSSAPAGGAAAPRGAAAHAGQPGKAARATQPSAQAQGNGPAAQGGGSGRVGTALLVGIFLLSAVAGGSVAGLYLAYKNNKSGASSGASLAAATSRADEKIVLSKSTERPVPPPMKKEETATAGKAATGKAATATAAPATGKDEERLASTPPAADTAPAMSPGKAGSDAPVAEAGVVELQKLTDSVVAALSDLNRTGQEEADIASVEQGTEKLRESLAELVSTALSQGKSEEEVQALLSAALEDAGEENVPAILRDASGKLNLQRLLASIMPRDASRDMPMSQEEQAYFDLLQEEAGKTAAATNANKARAKARGTPATKARKKPKKPKGRFFYENGKRYTIVRRGDTLSDIAYAAYGDILAYPHILRANRGRISARKLKPGTRIVIPERRRAKRKAKARQRSAAPIPLIQRKPAKAKAGGVRNKGTTNKNRPATRKKRLATGKKNEVLLGRVGDRRVQPARQARKPKAEKVQPTGENRPITNFRPARQQPETPEQASPAQ